MLIILEAANQGSDDSDETENKRTMMIGSTPHAMYTALFNHPPLKEYWNALIQKSLLSYDPNTQRFKTTAEGLFFLKAYKAADYDVMKARTTPSSPRRR
jgi:predicted transcriptional regulator